MDMKDLIGDDLGHDRDPESTDIEGRDTRLEVNVPERLDDVFRVCSDTNSQVGSLIGLIKALSARMITLEEQVKQLKNVTGRTEAMVGSVTYSGDGSPEATHARDAQNTKKVGSLVVAAVIRSVWHNNKGTDVPLPVDMKYLSKLCDGCFPNMDGKDKSDVGIMLTDQIASIEGDANAGNNIVAVLTSVPNVLASNMIRHLLECIKLLGTIYAFMLPYDLSALLNRVNVLNQGVVVLNDKIDENSMVRPHGGFNIKGQRMSEARFIKAFNNTVKLGNKRFDATRLCKCIENNMVSGDGTFTGVPSNAKVSKFSIALAKTSVKEGT